MAFQYVDLRRFAEAERDETRALDLQAMLRQDLSAYAVLSPRALQVPGRASLRFAAHNLFSVDIDPDRDRMTVGTGGDDNGCTMEVRVEEPGIFALEVVLDLWTGADSARIHISLPTGGTQVMPRPPTDEPHTFVIAAMMQAAKPLDIHFYGLHYFWFRKVRIEKAST